MTELQIGSRGFRSKAAELSTVSMVDLKTKFEGVPYRGDSNSVGVAYDFAELLLHVKYLYITSK